MPPKKKVEFVSEEKAIELVKIFKEWIAKKDPSLRGGASIDINAPDERNFRYLNDLKKEFSQTYKIEFNPEKPSIQFLFDSLVLVDEKLFHLSQEFLTKHQVEFIGFRKKQYGSSMKEECQEQRAMLIDVVWKFRKSFQNPMDIKNRQDQVIDFFNFYSKFSAVNTADEKDNARVHAISQTHSLKLLWPLLNEEVNISALVDVLLALDQKRLYRALMKLKGENLLSEKNALLVLQSTFPPDMTAYFITCYPDIAHVSTPKTILRNYIYMNHFKKVMEFRRKNSDVRPDKSSADILIEKMKEYNVGSGESFKSLDPKFNNAIKQVCNTIVNDAFGTQKNGVTQRCEIYPWSWKKIEREIERVTAIICKDMFNNNFVTCDSVFLSAGIAALTEFGNEYNLLGEDSESEKTEEIAGERAVGTLNVPQATFRPAPSDVVQKTSGSEMHDSPLEVQNKGSMTF